MLLTAMHNPALSIITINYNNAKGLQKTIESVLGQSFKELEFIIIDGGSTDGSVEVIKRFSGHIDYWVSEKDKGVYHAMNKGIKQANGTYLFFLNSGDCLASNTVIEETVPALNGEFIIYGDYQIAEPAKTWVKTYPDELLFSFFIEDALPHSGNLFIHRNAFKGELSEYDEHLKLASDWKWSFLAVYRFNYSYKHIKKTVGIFDYTGMSAQPGNHIIVNEEKKKVLEEYFPLLFKDMQNLLAVKKKYTDLLNSRFVKFYLSMREKIPLPK